MGYDGISKAPQQNTAEQSK